MLDNQEPCIKKCNAAWYSRCQIIFLLHLESNEQGFSLVRSRPWTGVMISPESWNGLQKRQTGDKNRSYPTWEKSLQDHQCFCLKCFCATLENSFQDHLGVRRAQAGYLGWVQARYWSNSGAGWQDPNHPQQGIYQCMFITSNKQEKELIIYTGRHDDPPTADEGLRGPSLVLVKDLRQSWGRGI